MHRLRHHLLHAGQLGGSWCTIRHAKDGGTNAVVACEESDVHAEREGVDRAQVRAKGRGPAAVRASQRKGDTLPDMTLRVGHLENGFDVRVEIDEAG